MANPAAGPGPQLERRAEERSERPGNGWNKLYFIGVPVALTLLTLGLTLGLSALSTALDKKANKDTVEAEYQALQAQVNTIQEDVRAIRQHIEQRAP